MNIQFFINAIYALCSYLLLVIDLFICILYKNTIRQELEDDTLRVIFIGIIILLMEYVFTKKCISKILDRITKNFSHSNTCNEITNDITLKEVFIPIATLIGLLVGGCFYFWVPFFSILLLIIFSIYPNPNIFFVYCLLGYRIFETEQRQIWIISKTNTKQQIIKKNLIKLNNNCFWEK